MPSTYEQVLGTVGNVVRAGTNAANKIGVFGSSPASPSSIRDAYLNGFFAETSKFSPGVFSRIFDEPTYLTFRIEFNFNPEMFQNEIPNVDKGINYKNLDDFPEPLLAIPRNRTPRNLSSDFSNNSAYVSAGMERLTGQLINGNAHSAYSSYTYLNEALGEKQRADMLYTFINGLKDIQDNYPYYFQSVEGLGDLLKVVPSNGIRLKDDSNTITIKCLEGLDLKITQLMQLYKNIVWDDYYQRWILSDMMRFFNMKIYVSEIRLFHSASASVSDYKSGFMYEFSGDKNPLNANSRDKLTRTGSVLESINNFLTNATAVSSRMLGTRSAMTNVLSGAAVTTGLVSDMGADYNNMMYHMCNNAINDVMPTICFDCHLCEFDIEDTASHINDLKSSNKESHSPEPTIKIKIGKMFVKQLYPINAALERDNNHYNIDLTKDLMAGSYFDDEYLRKNDRYSDNGISNLENITSNKSQDVDIDGISKTINRMYSKKDATSNVVLGIDARNSNEESLAYRFADTDKDLTVDSFLQGGINLLSNGRSEAVDINDATERRVRNSINVSMPERSRGTSDNNKLEPIRPENYPDNSEATNLSQSEETRLRQMFSDSPQEYAEAVKYIEKIRDIAYENDMINSATGSDTQKRVLSENFAKNILENISKSTATENSSNALPKMADMILNGTRSYATRSDNTINGFEKLNK